MNSGLTIIEQDLPQPPPVVAQTLELVQDPNTPNQILEELILGDDELRLASRILRNANSPYFSGHLPVGSIGDALRLVSRKQLANMIIHAWVHKLYHERSTPRHRELWNHAIATGVASHVMARSLQSVQYEDAFIAGVLHDVGKLIVLRRYPDIYDQYFNEAQRTRQRLCKLELRNSPHASHMLIGYKAIQQWKLPPVMAEAAGFHHLLEREIPAHLQDTALSCIVSLASVLANNLGVTTPVCPWDRMTSLASARWLNFGLYYIKLMSARVREVYYLQCAA